jgi:Spy/CpxP family protein refolding chaperone
MLAAEADAKEKSTRFSLFAEMVATLTPEERRQLHAWFEKRRARYDRRK